MTAFCDRIFKLRLNAAELPKLDAEFEEIVEGEDLTKQEIPKTKWAKPEAVDGKTVAASPPGKHRTRKWTNGKWRSFQFA